MAALSVPDDGTLADLATYLGRASRVDPGGATRLVARGGVLAAYVSPVNGGGGPTVIGLRVLRLAAPRDGATGRSAGEPDVSPTAAGTTGVDTAAVDTTAVDTTVPLAAMTDRLARVPASGDGSVVEVPLPPMLAKDATWAGVSPPRAGWQVVGAVARSLLLDAARDGVAAVAAGTPDGAGAAAVARLRAMVWGRDLPGVQGAPAGMAYAADALGFLGVDEPVALYATGAWRRLTTSRGHVLARASLLP
jgi:hypothetical protein